MKLHSWFLFLAMVFLWAFNWSMMKRALFIAPPLTFVFHRYLVSLGSLFVVLLILKPPMPRDRSILKKALVAGLLNLGSFVATNVGLSSYGSGMSAVLTYTQPLMVFGLAVVFLKQEASKLKLAGTLLGFLGVCAIFLEGGSSLTLSLPMVLLIFGAFLWAANAVYYKRFLNTIDAVFLNTLQMAVGLPILGVSSLALERHAFPFSVTYVELVIYAAVGATTIGGTFWYLLLRDEAATTLASSSFVVSILALGFGEWLLGENLDARSLIGSLLVLAGVYLVNRKKQHGDP